jgi:uncharacterized coiled-coil protein SlyX
VNDRIGTLQASRIAGQGLAIEDQKHIADGQSQTIAQQKDQISHLTDELQSMTKRAAELEVKCQRHLSRNLFTTSMVCTVGVSYRK